MIVLGLLLDPVVLWVVSAVPFHNIDGKLCDQLHTLTNQTARKPLELRG
jgi:hypothetical protein